MFRGKIQNKTNGVTPRRWIVACNKDLADLISKTLYDDEEWVTQCVNLRELAQQVDDEDFVRQFIEIKMNNKRKL